MKVRGGGEEGKRASSLSGSPAVAVALLVVGAVQRVPLQFLSIVGEHLFHGLQCFGYGALL